ncbi:MAG: M23 family metallopeptidase [Treponema sp.]|nr:M23 family metallopeptidase [Treponema sp.]
MKKAKAVVFLGMAFCLSLRAMDWPGGQIQANFGLNEQGRPALGTVFQADSPVLAADNGELVFYRGQEEPASRLPSPLGFWAALDHGDGIQGIYGRFEDPGEGKPPVQARRGEAVASSGSSGWTNLKGFYFALFDRRERRWVNPSLIIAPLDDDSPPQIQQIQLRSSDGRIIPPGQTRISQGLYSIIVTAVDTLSRTSAVRLAPHRLAASLNGIEVGSLSFETYSARNGTLLLNRNIPAPVSVVYAPYPAFDLGEAWFTRGQTTLELIARDVWGNESSSVRRLEVE